MAWSPVLSLALPAQPVSKNGSISELPFLDCTSCRASCPAMFLSVPRGLSWSKSMNPRSFGPGHCQGNCHSSKSASKDASVHGWCEGHSSPRDPFLGPLTDILLAAVTGTSNDPKRVVSILSIFRIIKEHFKTQPDKSF